MDGKSSSPNRSATIMASNMVWKPVLYVSTTSLALWAHGMARREKAPAALCRKVVMAKLTGNPEVEIWGDGKQTRSFCYIDDCLTGIFKLMRSDYREPLNLGQDRMVTINQLADMVAEIAGIEIVKKHVPGPQGVRGRNSDNTRLLRGIGLGTSRSRWKMA